jgi:hypothetical protein
MIEFNFTTCVYNMNELHEAYEQAISSFEAKYPDDCDYIKIRIQNVCWDSFGKNFDVNFLLTRG